MQLNRKNSITNIITHRLNLGCNGFPISKQNRTEQQNGMPVYDFDGNHIAHLLFAAKSGSSPFLQAIPLPL